MKTGQSGRDPPSSPASTSTACTSSRSGWS